MTAAQIIQLVVSIVLAVLFGGLAGSWYTNHRIEKRNRVQVIDLEKQITTVEPQTKGLSVRTSLTVSTPEGESYTVESFFIVRLLLANHSDRDFQTFPFGVKLPTDTTIISVETRCPDHQHALHLREIPDEGRGRYQRSWEAVPFTREETYELVFTVAPAVTGRAVDLERLPTRPLQEADVEVGTLLAGVRFSNPSGAGRRHERLLTIERRVRMAGLGAAMALIAALIFTLYSPGLTSRMGLPILVTVVVIVMIVSFFALIVEVITGQKIASQF